MAIDKLQIGKKEDNPTRIAQIAKAGLPAKQYLTAAESNAVVEKINEMIPEVNVGVSGFQGKIGINDIKTDIGFYFPEESGIYVHADNINVDISEGMNQLLFDGEKWDKIVIPFEANGKVEEGDLGFVSGDTIARKKFLDPTKIISKTYLKDSKRNFTGSELEVIDIIKDIKLYSKINFSDELALETLCGPKFKDEPGRLRIKNITKNTIYSIKLKVDHLEFRQSFKIDNDTTMVVNIDWTGYEDRDIIHNRLWDITKNLIFDSTYLYQHDISLLDHKTLNIEKDLNKVLVKEEVKKFVDTLNNLPVSLYGSSKIFGYSFPIGRFEKPIYGVKYNALVNGTKFRIVISEKDLKGKVLIDKTVNVDTENIIVLFEESIKSSEDLYVRVISNSDLRVLRHEPNTVFTVDKGYSKVAFTLNNDAITNNDVVWGGFTFADYQIDILTDIEDVKIHKSAIPEINTDISIVNNLIKKELKIAAVGSSVTWGRGFLQDSMLEYLIPYLQRDRTNFVGYDEIISDSSFKDIGGANNIQLFDYKARKFEGIGASLEFEIEGDEVSIVQAIDRTNNNASLIDIYIDDKLYDTISNYNTAPIGKEIKKFVAVQGQKEYLLERPFTYNHILKVNGVIIPVSLSKSMTAPIKGWIIARDLQNINGKVIVQHTLFNMDASSAGDSIEISYDYGQEIVYEKTTVGKDGNGILENQYGRGYTSFDPANPPTSFSFGTGLDFRQTDERVVSKYVFDEYKKRKVKIVIKGLDSRATDQTSKPYFIFNFATSRMLYFMNAGIGGWKSSQFDDPNNANGNINRTWREVAEFQPTHVFYESTPNDDWSVAGYKVYSERNNISLSDLQKIRTLPNKEIKYNTVTNDYNYHRWCGYISAIDKWSVTISEISKITSDPKEGDIVVIGTYGTDNRQQIVRNIRSYDVTTRRVYFDRIINSDECVYDNLQMFIGKEIQIRDLKAYIEPTESLLAKLKSYANFPQIYLVPNPAPNMLSRDLASYQAYLKKLAKKETSKYGYRLADGYLEIDNVIEWQMSQPLNKEVIIPASSLIDGRVDLPQIGKSINYLNFRVFIDGIDITNKNAYILTAYCLGVDRKLSGSEVNDWSTRGKQQWEQFSPTLVFERNIPTTGNITIKYSDVYWSGDSCHMGTSQARKLFANAYLKLF